MDKFNFVPGEYKILVDRLLIRGTPDTTQNGNLVRDSNGVALKLQLGQSVPVYRVITTKAGWVWGVITAPPSDNDHYICLWNLNTRFAELVNPFDDNAPVDTETRLSKLEAWARSKGYTG